MTHSHKKTQLLSKFTESEHKTAHRIKWITTQNEYSRNYFNKNISVIKRVAYIP
jgi:hypothetical protein